MALTANAGLASFGQVQGQFLDLSDVLAELIRSDNTAFLSHVPMIGAATEVQHSWVEDSLNPMTVTSASTLASNASSLTMYLTGASNHLTIGAILRNQASSGNALNELLQVTATNAAGSLTITRAYGNTTGTAHAAEAVYSIVATPAQEDADSPADITKARAKYSNYTQVFLRGVKVSYTAQAILQAGVPSEFGHQTSYRLKELMRELDSSLILSAANATTGSGSASQYRSMGGLLQFAVGGSCGVVQVLPTGATYVTSETLTPDVLNTMASAIFYNGGMTAGPYRGFILVGGKQKRRIAQFDQSYRRSDYNQAKVGYTVEKFLSDLGYEFQIIVDPSMPDDVCVLGDLNRLKVMPLKGQAMKVEDIAKTGRALKGMITGEIFAHFYRKIECKFRKLQGTLNELIEKICRQTQKWGASTTIIGTPKTAMLW